MKQILIDIQRIADVAAGDPELSDRLWRALRDLADELNSALPEYETGLLHLDTGDYLAFVRRDPEEGAYWADQEEQRREHAEILAEEEPEDPHGEYLFDQFVAHGVTRAEIARMDLKTLTQHIHEMRTAGADVDDLALTDEEIARQILEFARAGVDSIGARQ
ncbi:MAG TPA: hypothetical protein VMY40_15590 [Anaerolineae bacterium]|nr:hypothetical protein [Anaerolineae bacterium]